MPSTVTRERFVSWQHEPDPTAPSKARGRVREALASWDLDDPDDVTATVITELVTNGVAHGEGPVAAQISYDGLYLHLKVHDNGPGRPVWRLADSWDESGRGLALIAGLIGPWGTIDVTDDAAGAGKTVHVAIRVEKSAEFTGVRTVLDGMGRFRCLADAKDSSV